MGNIQNKYWFDRRHGATVVRQAARGSKLSRFEAANEQT
jgi:hypothetical protein